MHLISFYTTIGSYVNVSKTAYFLPVGSSTPNDYIVRTCDVPKYYELPKASAKTVWNERLLVDKIEDYVGW